MKEDRSPAATPVVLPKNPVRCAVYIRALFGASRAAESVRIQREAAQAFLKKRAADGWVCSGIYEDIGYSGATLDRPELQRLLTAINAGTVDCIIVHTLDRLARMNDALGQIVVLPRLYDVNLIVLSPKPFVVISSAQGRESNVCH